MNDSDRRSAPASSRRRVLGAILAGSGGLGVGAGATRATDARRQERQDGPAGREACYDLSSPAFEDRARIPPRYSCDGENVSPQLEIAGVREEAGALALLVDDPDAGDEPFTHWLLWNLPADAAAVPAGVPAEETLPDLGGARQGTNDAGRVGYAGPCPPRGDPPHTYRFRLYALASPLDLEPGADRAAFLDAVADAALEATLLAGVFVRPA